ncbi:MULTISPECIES: DUF4123 domain-containing protein [unclassified Halomonas]|uniref:DUF4123 domain-containing protein n=1 Tax=unclassified Halomonas TaxID=2609666 RepID=UPI00209F2B29|nr:MULTISPECIES: DUF4123 domain-containing protein [unclassified Halomonas]MCP1313322.1 DUF4123 domain-containing protein [Halomonas sp. 707D7]MCP1325912.1 DUF4123 domain-containing protein [Halomonas sp. 707D4]
MSTGSLPSWEPLSPSQVPAIKRYALIEMALLSGTTRTTLFNEIADKDHYWSLIKDENQPHLQREGPWLLSIPCDQQDKLNQLEGMACALLSWIETPLAGAELASHLAPAMVVENPQKQRSLLRFYLPDVITQLHEDALENSANALFSRISRWWYRDTAMGWVALEGQAPTKCVTQWQLVVDEARWQALHGEPEVMQLTAELVDFAPALFEGICHCERPRHVAKALMQANHYGLTAIADKRTFVYVQLSQGSDAWAPEEMQRLLQRATGGEAKLAEVLVTTYQQDEP